MEDIDEMFNDLLGEIDLLTQSLAVETVPPEVPPSSHNDHNFSIGFTDLNESLNGKPEVLDLDALIEVLASGATPPKPAFASLPPPPQDYIPCAPTGHHNTTSANVPAPSQTGPPPPTALPQPSKPLPLEETEEQTEEDKIKLALEKLKQAKIKKMVIKVLMNDGSSKALMVEEQQTVREVLDSLFEKTHCDCGVDWSLCETNPELQIERGLEDHENLVDILSAWTRDSENKILFLEKKDKYAIFKNPQNYYLWTKDKNLLKGMKEKEKEKLLEEKICRGSIIVPDLEGVLYLKEDGKKSWKQKYFLLRASGIYYVPKGKTKNSSDLACFIQFENVNVYYATGTEYKNKHKVPTEFCFILKHPQIQKDSPYIKHLCCDDEWTMNLWVMGIRIAKYGEKLHENYKTASRKAWTNSAWTNRNVSTPSTPSPVLKDKAANGCATQTSHQPKPLTTVFPEAKDYGGDQVELSFPPPPHAADMIQFPTPPDLSTPSPPPPSASAALPPKALPALPQHQSAAFPPPVPDDFPPPPPDFFPEPPPDFLPPPVHRLSPSSGGETPLPKPAPLRESVNPVQTRKKIPPNPPPPHTADRIQFPTPPDLSTPPPPPPKASATLPRKALPALPQHHSAAFPPPVPDDFPPPPPDLFPEPPPDFLPPPVHRLSPSSGGENPLPKPPKPAPPGASVNPVQTRKKIPPNPPPPHAADRIQFPTPPDLSTPPPPPPKASAALPPKALPALPQHQSAAFPPPAPDDFPPPPPHVHRLSPSSGGETPPHKPARPGTSVNPAQTRKKMPPNPPKRTTAVSIAPSGGNMM